MSYNLTDYCNMIQDSVRTQAYAKALEQVITPDSVVLDMGCGTGIFCLLACKLGAKRVYGIEPNEAIEVGKKIAEKNGYGDRITFFAKKGKDVVLPEKATVMVSDLRGTLPLYGHHFQILEDARERLLTQDAIIIPMRDKLFMSPVSDKKTYTDMVMPWGTNDFGFDFSEVTHNLTGLWQHATFSPKAKFAEPQLWTELNYQEDLPTTVNTRGVWNCDSKRIYHGLCLWFDCTLTDTIGYSANPTKKKIPTVYGNGFFPFSKPLAVGPGDTLSVELSANRVSESFLFSWNTTLRSGNHETSFKQSTMTHQTFSQKSLRRRSDDHRPDLNEDGKIAQTILNGIDAGLTLGDISKQIATTFPKRFPSWQRAMGLVGNFSIAYDSSETASL